ncbi:hypothetical protein LO762_02200 [Actinocorallia sp. API 0066]|uniref:hypothetical protein n=1 Tax=Actinocorallia sp. API 0066 TaxID=2896846 RepID=UPI001E50AFD2|nr:hypothetical protein [Actinocorallia sp. API 0066]MCD0448013.1 hypothetical protein [Actinocorallia sp. API 0066]
MTTTTRSASRTLARLEAARYARHPLFLVGLALLLLATVVSSLEDPVPVDLLSYPLVPAMTLGVFGLVVAARLTRSVDDSLETLGGSPVPESTRTAALALACLVPAAVGLAWTAYTLVFHAFNRPVPDAWWYDTLPTAHVVGYYLGAAAIASYGGPILGVVIARWVRWAGAPIVAAVGLVAVTIAGQGIIEPLRTVRTVLPWTHWYGGDNGAGADYHYQGNPLWWAVYTLCLCGLGVLLALFHDKAARTRGLVLCAALLAVAALTATTLAMVTGPQETRLSPPTLHPAQVG